MAAGLVSHRQQNELSSLYALDFVLGNAQLRRINEIVGGVHEHYGRGDLLQIRRGIIIAGGFNGVENVVGVGISEACFHEIVDVGVRHLARGIVLLVLERGGAGDDEEVERRAEAERLLRVLAALVVGGQANGVDHHLTPPTVTSSNLHRQAGERHGCIHEARIRFEPDPRMHAPHRGTHDQAQMVDMQAFGEEKVLGGDHVVVVVVRKAGAQSITGFAGATVADVVGENDEVLSRVEELAGAEEHTCKARAYELLATASGPVQDKDRVSGATPRVSLGAAIGGVMDLKFWEGFAAAELKIAGDEVVLFGILRKRRGREEEKNGKDLHGVEASHFRPPTFKRKHKVIADGGLLSCMQASPLPLGPREDAACFPRFPRYAAI